MLELTLQPIPNQSFTARLGDSNYQIRIHSCQGIMVMDVTRDNIEIIKGARMVAGYPVIPYEYLEDGNFFMLTADDELPNYTQFGDDQFLFYVTAEEIGELRAGT